VADQFAAAVRRFRSRAGLTQEALAERSGVSVRTIRGLETGKRANPQFSSVKLLADALGLLPHEHEELLAMARPGLVQVPRQLPPEPAGFVGRTHALDRLDAVLADTGTSALAISVVSGTAGVGKTTLALHWAHRVAERFPGGQLYLDLRGFDPDGTAMTPSEALRVQLEALGLPSQAVPDGLEARAARYRTMTAGRSTLVVLDNVRDAAQVRPLLPGTPGSLVVITSRNDLTGLIATTNAASIPLTVLAEDESRALLADRLGPARVAAEPAAVAEIVRCCAGLPLALAVVAARAAPTSFSLAAYAGKLREESLDGFGSGDGATDLRTVFSCSYQALSPAAARMFRLLGLHPGTEISIPAAASTAGVPMTVARRALHELVRAHMINESAPGRFTFHDLLRAFAAEQIHPDERQDAVHRLVAHYLHNAQHARAVARSMPMPQGRIPSGVVTVTHVDGNAALEWLRTETASLLSVVRSGHGSPAEIIALVRIVSNVLDARGELSGNADVLHRGEALAAREGDLTGQVAMWKMIARLHLRQGRFGEAEVLLQKALEIDGESGDVNALAYTRSGLGRLFGAQNRHREALEHARLARKGFREAGNHHAEAEILNGIAWCHAELEEFDEAARHAEQALAIKKANGMNKADVLDTLGYVEHRRGNVTTAIARYLAALPDAEDEGNLYTLAEVLGHLGDAYDAAGNAQEALRCWTRSATQYEELHSPLADVVRARIRG
jgi:tetratricopeptide (TPR) repeat protein/transcriptional regulator with XRE-family HTH domain